MESLEKRTVGKLAIEKDSSEVMELGIGKKQKTVVIKGKCQSSKRGQDMHIWGYISHLLKFAPGYTNI